MERYRRGKGKKALLGSHQKCWIWGRNLVTETLAAGRWPVLELYLADSLPAPAARRAMEQAARLGVPVRAETAEQLRRRCHSAEHQGYLARMAEFPYAEEQAVLANASSAPVYAVADCIQDPHNFGAMVRSAEVFGVDAFFISERGQAPVTSLVARSSAGAVSRVPIVRTPDIPALLDRLRGRGVRVAGASEKAAEGLAAFDFTRAVAIVIGNEGAGLRPEVRARCDALLRIPQYGAIGSLNAAAAAAVFFYEMRRQRGAN